MAKILEKLGIDGEVRLIEAVREQKPLFDKRVDGYHRSKDLIWENVAKQVNSDGFDGEKCKKAWGLLRGQYMAHRRKLKKPSGSGQTGVRPYFRHEESMKFINDSLGEEKTYSNLGGEENNDNVSDNPEQVPDADVVDVTPVSRSATDHRSHSKFSAKRKLDAFDEGLLDLLKSDEKDEFSSFGDVVAAKLRNVAVKNKRMCLELQHKINQEIYNAELLLV